MEPAKRLEEVAKVPCGRPHAAKLRKNSAILLQQKNFRLYADRQHGQTNGIRP
jgi:hypothetical protein